MPELVLYGIRELAEQHYEALDQWESSLDIPRPMRVENTGRVLWTKSVWWSLWPHYCRMLSQLSHTEPCSGLQFNSDSCLALVEKCYSPQFSAEMKDFFLERAIQFKQWMVLAKKLLDITHAKSVFYFFSPFLLQFCLMNELKWYHIFYEECLHVKRWVNLINDCKGEGGWRWRI